MITHELKIDPRYLSDLLCGNKTFEIRFNDRDYQCGERLLFTDESDAIFIFLITYIHKGLGLKDGYIAMSVHEL